MYHNGNCQYLPHRFDKMPPHCPHIGIISSFVMEFRKHEDGIAEEMIPDLTDIPPMFPEMMLDFENQYDPASYPLYCGICELLHSRRIYRPFPEPHEGV